MKAMSKVLVVVLVLGLALAAVAASTKNVTLRSDASLNGTKLTAGEYKVVVDGDGPDVKVSFMQKGKVIATADGKLVDNGGAPEFSAVVVTRGDGGSSIQELRIAGMKSKVVFNQ